MATNEVKRKTGAQWLFADHLTDFGVPTALNDITIAGYTDVQIDLTSLANTAGRESAKVDLGATRAGSYTFIAAIETAAASVAGERIDFYWAPSDNATAGEGNPGLILGADAAAPSSAHAATLAQFLLMCQFVGSGIVEDTANTVQLMPISSMFVPAARHGILVVVNESDGALIANANEHCIAMTENLVDIQAAA